LAGLKRLGLEAHATNIMPVHEFLPAAGQGIIGTEVRANDTRMREILARIDHADTSIALACERAFLAVLDGSCKTPIGGYAEVSSDTIRFRGLLAHPDGEPSCEYERSGSRADAIKIGTEAGHAVKRKAPAGLVG
jgi:hydroxymethylbilane synthase